MGDYVYDDDYSKLHSHFDKIDFPAGIEAPFPPLPDLAPRKKENPVVSNAHLEGSVSQLNRVDPWPSSSKKNTAVLGHSTYLFPNYVRAQTMQYNSRKLDSNNSLSNSYNTQVRNVTSNDHLKASVSQMNRVDPWLSYSKKNTAAPGHSMYLDPKFAPAQTMQSKLKPIGWNRYLSKNSNTQVDPWCFSSKKSTAIPGQYTYLDPNHVPAQTMHSNFTQTGSSAGMLPGTGGVYTMQGKLLGQYASVNRPSLVSSSHSGSSSSLAKLVDGDVRKRYESFVKFDTVVDYSDHYYANQNPVMQVS